MEFAQPKPLFQPRVKQLSLSPMPTQDLPGIVSAITQAVKRQRAAKNFCSKTDVYTQITAQICMPEQSLWCGKLINENAIPAVSIAVLNRVLSLSKAVQVTKSPKEQQAATHA
jgi:hypothetical protein